MMKEPLLKRTFLKQMTVLIGAMLSPCLMAIETSSLSEKQLKALNLKQEGVVLDLPPLADTGNSIPFSIQIQAPRQQLIQSFEIIAPENPNPLVLKVTLPNPKSNYRMATRIRLAMSQNVWVIAQLSDGSKISGVIPSVVTLNACFDAT
jgi:predicted secreted protein